MTSYNFRRNHTATATAIASQQPTTGNATSQVQPLFFSFTMEPKVKESVEDTSKVSFMTKTEDTRMTNADEALR
ncbi:hypothetical protein BX616_003228 [Lobosporangium transversale]|nr:hypothetical protein BX616_003228 [Lobosporangium transversale]